MKVKTILTDAQLREAADKGADELINLLVETLYQHVGGSLTQENIQRLNTYQLTLVDSSNSFTTVMVRSSF